MQPLQCILHTNTSIGLWRLRKVTSDDATGFPIYGLNWLPIRSQYINICPQCSHLWDINVWNMSDLELDILRSPEVKCDGILVLPIHDFLLVALFKSKIWRNLARLRWYIYAQYLCHKRCVKNQFEKLNKRSRGLDTLLDLLPDETKFMANGNVTEATFRQSAVHFFLIWQITRKSNSLYSPHAYHTFHKVYWMTPTVLKESDIKSVIHMQLLIPRVTNFHPFRSTISRFQDMEHFRICPLAPMLNFNVPQNV